MYVLVDGNLDLWAMGGNADTLREFSAIWANAGIDTILLTIDEWDVQLSLNTMEVPY